MGIPPTTTHGYRLPADGSFRSGHGRLERDPTPCTSASPTHPITPCTTNTNAIFCAESRRVPTQRSRATAASQYPGATTVPRSSLQTARAGTSPPNTLWSPSRLCDRIRFPLTRRTLQSKSSRPQTRPPVWRHPAVYPPFAVWRPTPGLRRSPNRHQ